jgi:tetratricopeptide (TPR) repeat protein
VKRVRRWVAASALFATASAGATAGRAEEKKKPGLFDFDTWKAPVTREREAAQQLAPGTLDLTPAPGRPVEPRAIRVRIYADRDYQSLVYRWQAKARAQIERIDAVVGAVFGVRFEIESLREWDRSHFGVPLEAIGKELAALDPGSEVDLVIGLATPLRGVATSIHQIGFAQLCSRHFVLRGMDDEQEMLALDAAYKLLSVEERRRLYGDRKAHKEIVVFLHEWGHTLGLLHNEDRAIVMNPAYDPQQRAFSEFEKRVVMLAVDRRLGHRGEPLPEATDLAALLAHAPADEGSDAERHDLRAFLQGRPRGGEGPSAAVPGATDLSATEIEAFNKAVTAVNAGRAEEAWTLLAPIVRHAALRQTQPATWRRLGELAAAAGALSAAEDAIARVRSDPDAVKVAGDIDARRHRVALPPDAAKLGVPPEREPAYVAAYREAAHLVLSEDLPAARTRLAAFTSAFPGTPAADLLACDLELRAKHTAAATKSCEAALAKFKGATRAHYLLGLIAARSRRDALAEQHLRRAIVLDPQDPTAWRALGAMYRESGAKQRLTQLANEHQALLSSPLPE